MDVKLEKPPAIHRIAKGLTVLALMGFTLLCFWIYQLITSESTTRVPFSRVTLYTVQRSTFTDTLVSRAQAIPSESVIIASEHGGKVIARRPDTTATVKKGEVIAQLSNDDLVLQATSRIAAATEQTNNLRNMRLLLEKDNLDTQLALEKSRCQLQRIDKELNRKKTLYHKGILEIATYENLVDEQTHWQKSLAILTEYKQRQDQRLPFQLAEIEASVNHLDKLTHLINEGLEQLIITSPIDGTLSSFTIKQGQQIKPGEKIANVDNLHSYYFEAAFSEYYLDKIKPHQQVIAHYGGEDIPLIIASVSATVDNGKFMAKLTLAHPHPLALKRGQSVDIRIPLETTQNALLVPSEALFFQNDQAQVYLYDEKKHRAVRTPVEIKRQGAAQSEVVSGLTSGQQVVVFIDNSDAKSPLIEFE